MWSGGGTRASRLLHGRHEIVGDRAADAAVGQLDDVVLGAAGIAAAEQQLAVDADLAELVDDQRDAAAAGMRAAGGGSGWSCRRRGSPVTTVVGNLGQRRHQRSVGDLR